MELVELTGYLDRELNLAAFKTDHSNNGLQIEGASAIGKALFGVDGSMQLFEEAARRGANFIFVHHGISWGGNPRRFIGMDGARLRFLFQHNISLYAAHLPLDANMQFGNNAELARMAGLLELTPYCEYDGVLIGLIGKPNSIMTARSLAVKFETELDCTAALAFPSEHPVRKVAVVSGGGGMDALEQAAEAGADLLLTGELTHVMYHAARELGVSVLALGHYASETTGPKALMKKIQRELQLDCEFVDLPTGL